MASTFPAALAAARTARDNAQKALDLAINHTTPFPADLLAELERRYPVKFAEAQAKIAEIEATLPALRDAIPPLAAAYDALFATACHRCDGTGEYAGASGYITNGRKLCFTCGGIGTDARTRTAAAKARKTTTPERHPERTRIKAVHAGECGHPSTGGWPCRNTLPVCPYHGAPAPAATH